MKKGQLNVLISNKHIKAVKEAAFFSDMTMSEWMETALNSVFEWEEGDDEGIGVTKEVRKTCERKGDLDLSDTASP